LARVSYTEEALADLDRLFEFLGEEDPHAALAAIGAIRDGVELLDKHPLLGRRVSAPGIRELVISRGKTGYLALYQYQPALDVVLVVAIRHQREAGYTS